MSLIPLCNDVDLIIYATSHQWKGLDDGRYPDTELSENMPPSHTDTNDSEFA